MTLHDTIVVNLFPSFVRGLLSLLTSQSPSVSNVSQPPFSCFLLLSLLVLYPGFLGFVWCWFDQKTDETRRHKPETQTFCFPFLLFRICKFKGVSSYLPSGSETHLRVRSRGPVKFTMLLMTGVSTCYRKQIKCVQLLQFQSLTKLRPK